LHGVGFIAASVINILHIWHILTKFGLNNERFDEPKMSTSIISITGNYEAIEEFAVTTA
jgi:hypothetical protein